MRVRCFGKFVQRAARVGWRRHLLCAGVLLSLLSAGTALPAPPAPLAQKAFERGLQFCEKGSPEGPLWLAEAVKLDPNNANYRTALFQYQSSYPRLRDVVQPAGGWSDGKMLVSEGELFRVADGSRLAFLANGALQDVVFSPAGNCLATLDIGGRAQVFRLPDGEPLGPAHEGVISLALDAKGERLAIATHKLTAQVFRVSDGKALTGVLSAPDSWESTGHLPGVYRLAFAHQSSLLLGGCVGGACVWNGQGSLQQAIPLPGMAQQVAFSPDDRKLFLRSVGRDTGVLGVFDTLTGQPRGRLDAPCALVTACWDPRGYDVVSLDEDGMVRMLRSEPSIKGLEKPLEVAWAWLEKPQATLAYSPDGEKVLVTTPSLSRVLDISNGEWATAGFAGGERGLFLSGHEVLTMGAQTRLWDISSSRPMRREDNLVGSCGWTARGTYWLVSDGVLRIKDPETGNLIAQLEPGESSRWASL